MKALLNGLAVTLRGDLTLEMFPGEILEWLPAQPDRVELVSINGEPAEVTPDAPEPTDLRIMLETVGRYHFRYYDRDGRHDLWLTCCEPALLGWVERTLRSLGHGGEPASPERARRVIRGMCARPDFDGTILWCTRAPGNGPIYFGA